jgi:hypothetical protein
VVIKRGYADLSSNSGSPRNRTTSKSNASQTAEKQDDFEIEENHIFEDSILYTTSYDTKCVLLDSLYPSKYVNHRNLSY